MFSPLRPFRIISEAIGYSDRECKLDSLEI